MRKLMFTAGLAAVLATGLMAGQCTPADTEAQVKAIQDLAISICKFEPSAQSVAQILAAAGEPAVPGASAVVKSVADVANAICAIATAKAASPDRTCIGHVNGVCVAGAFKE
jgi:hypothetical protein